MPSSLKNHVMALILAFTIFLMFIYVIWEPQDAKYVDIAPKYMLNVESIGGSENYDPILSRAMAGDSVLVLGSSELTSSTKHTPYNFLNEHGIPTIGFGHAYFELLAIYGYLTAYQDQLSDRSKIVIILSPGWFNSTDLMPQAFVEHFPHFMLSKLSKDQQARSIFTEYVERNESQFNNSSAIRQVLTGSIPIQINNFFLNIRNNLFNSPTEINTQQPVTFAENGQLSCSPELFDEKFWSDNRDEAIEIGLSTGMSEETLWSGKAYYEKYLKDRSNKNYFTTLDSSLELSALDNVLSILKKKNVEALFVMMPLNPFVYEDIERFDSVEAIIEGKIVSSGMGYFNLIENPYIPTTLNDGMHMGELGWVKMNEEIIGYFCK